MKTFWALILCASSALFAEEMVMVPGGVFVMGAKDGKPDEQPVKTVQISPFMMDKCEVTQKDFLAVMGVNPSHFVADANNPVERTTWMDAAKYCNARSIKEGLKPCYDPKTWECDFTANGYRLPTEAEWEYACRAGSKTALNFTGGVSKMGAVAWTRSNSQAHTHKAGTRKPNAFGLYDMYGNVLEWCNDWYEPNYNNVAAKDPRGPKTGKKRVLRGGSWQDREKNITSSRRWADDPATADICQGYDTYGFRCVKNVPPVKPEPKPAPGVKPEPKPAPAPAPGVKPGPKPEPKPAPAPVPVRGPVPPEK